MAELRKQTMSTTLKDITTLLGGRKTLRRKVSTSEEMLAVVRAGLPMAALEQVMISLNISREEIEPVIALPSRTMTRRKKEKVLQSVESDRLMRLTRVAAHAITALGSEDKAAQWLHRPNRGLGGESPLHRLDTDLGATQVDDILTRLEHGVVG